MPKQYARSAAPKPAPQTRAKKGKGKGGRHGPPVAARASARTWFYIGGAGLALYGLGVSAPQTFLTHFTVFVLACFIGYHVVWSVSPALHTPLMSVTNAISGIIVLGGMVQLGGGTGSAAEILGLLAVFIAMINVSGGFLVTQRMLKMFRK